MFIAFNQVVRGDVTGASIRAISARLNFASILHNEGDHFAEAAKQFRIVLAYARAWPHKDTNKPTQEIVMDLFRTSHDALCLIDNNHPAARQKGEEMAAEHFRALEAKELFDSYGGCDPLALFFRGHTLQLKLLRAMAQRDQGVAHYLTPQLFDYGWPRDAEMLQSGQCLSDDPMSAAQVKNAKEQSRRLLVCAAAKGEPNANLILGLLLQQDTDSTSAVAHACGYKLHWMKAAECFKIVDECGIKEGTHNLARMYQFNRVPGCGDAESLTEAIRLFEKSNAQGNYNSTINLVGLVVLNGDRARGAALLRKAIEDGHKDEAMKAAERIRTGLGIDIWDPSQWGDNDGGRRSGDGDSSGGGGGGGGGDSSSGAGEGTKKEGRKTQTKKKKKKKGNK